MARRQCPAPVTGHFAEGDPEVFKQLGAKIPDLGWSIKDIWTADDRIFVRGEATGTPVGDLFGAPPTGRSFKTMSLDVFTVKGDKPFLRS